MTSFQGPGRFVADWSVPKGQFKIRLPLRVWMDMVAGGLTVTVVVPGVEAHAPTVAVTL